LSYCQQIGIKVEGVELNEITSGTSVGLHTHEAGASILLIGMRGRERPSLATWQQELYLGHASTQTFYFEEKHKIGVREFVLQRGWSAFRDAELTVIKELIETKPPRAHNQSWRRDSGDTSG
jgi:pentafunctional AROM polypeptide